MSTEYQESKELGRRSIATSVPNEHSAAASEASSSMELERGASPSKEAPVEEVLPDGIIGRVLSKTATRVSQDPGPPPDGGLRAWTQAFMGHLVVFNVWGYVNTFGVFQAHYASTLGHPPSDISWVGSVQIFLLFFVGTFSGRATDAGLFRVTFAAGSFFLVFGIFMTSLATEYWQIFLAQGVCTGLGNGLLFCPSLALLSTYFTTHRSLAIGVAASGTATGGVIYPIIVQRLLGHVGFAWTVRVIGFVALVIQLTTLAFLKTRLPPRKSGPIVEWAAFTELPYLLFSIGMFLVFWGLYFAFYYIPSFGRDIIGISYADSINNLLILNAIGLPGRLVPAYLADRFFGPLNLIIFWTFAAGATIYSWPAVTERSGLIAFSVFYGIFGAGIQSLFPATLTSLTTDLQKAGIRIGMVFTVCSVASLTGPPLAGALIQKHGGNYLYAQIFAGTVLVTGSLMCVFSRISKVGLRKARV